MRVVPKIFTFEPLQNGKMVLRDTQLALASPPPIDHLIKDRFELPSSGRQRFHFSLRLAVSVDPSQGPL